MLATVGPKGAPWQDIGFTTTKGMDIHKMNVDYCR